MRQFIFDKVVKSQRLLNSIRTRFIAVAALLISVITFGGGFLVFLYMKSPNFENQLLGQVIKHLRPMINYEIDKGFEERNLNLKSLNNR